MATSIAETTEQLWERWPTLSHAERLNQFRQMHTAEKAEFFQQLSARDQSDLLLR
jgi:magnesium transporter